MRKAEQTLFGKRLRKLRENKGWSQERLGCEAGLSTRVIYNYESGINFPRQDNAEYLASALEVSITKLCPFFSIAPLNNLLIERIKEEVKAVDAFIRNAKNRDYEKLEKLLQVYNLCTANEKLDVDIVIHRMISSFDRKGAKKKVNTLVLQYFAQIDEFLIDSDLFTEENEEKLSAIHNDLVKAALNKNQNEMFRSYEKHLEFSKQFLVRTFDLGSL